MSVITAKDRLGSLVDDITVSLQGEGITLTNAQVTELKRVAGTWLDNTQFKTLGLAANKPDYNQILLQFQNMLEHEDAWRDTIAAGAGQAILRFIAAAVTYTVYASERATQERYAYLARMPSAIYASARSLGVRITRRVPAKVPVSLVRPGSDALVVPAFTAITVGTTKFFNRKAISFGRGNIAPVEAELVQGEVFIDTYNSPGAPLVTYEVGNGEGNISEEDVYLYVDDQEFTRVEEAFFDYGADDRVFYENTMANGNVEVITGTGNFGVMPASNSTIKIRYATTLGVEAMRSTVELPVMCPDFPQVTGKSIAPITGAIAPRSPEFYRVNAPHMRAKNKRATSPRDYASVALDYKPVKIFDAKAVGQQDIAPTKKWAIGLIKICPLTEIPMDDTQWLQFSEYLQARAIEGFTVLRENAVPVPIDVRLTMGMHQDFSLEAARLAAISEITDAYAPKQGVLGREFFKDDISTILNRSKHRALANGINWLDVELPTEVNIQLKWNEYIKINSVTALPQYSNRDYSNRVVID